MNEKEMKLIREINEKILKDYNMEVNEIGESKASVLAFFSPDNKMISINKHSKYIFNDYALFIEVMLHENVHKINDKNNLEDVYMEGDKQIHNEQFRDTMLDEYDIYCNELEYNGSADMGDKRNYPFFEKLVRNKILHKKEFAEIQDFYLKEIYEPSDEEGEHKPSDEEGEDAKEGNEENENESKENEDEREDSKGDDYQEKDSYSWNEEEGVEIKWLV